MPECLDLSIQLPQFHVVTINELLGEPDSIVAPQINAILNMAVRPHDVGAILFHLLAPNRD